MWGAHIRGTSLKGAHELVPSEWKETNQRGKVRVFQEREIENPLRSRAEKERALNSQN